MTSFRTVCTTQAAASLSSGVLLLLLPSPVLGLFSLPDDAGTQIVTRMLGGILFALGATLLGARDVTGADQRTRIMVGNAACDGAVTVMMVSALLAHQLAAAGWVLAALFAVNAVTWLVALRSR